MLLVSTKPNTPQQQKRPRPRAGHPGKRRAQPIGIDDQRMHRLPRYPDCHGRYQHCQRGRTRISEDIPEQIQPVVTEHIIHRDYCPRCKKHMEPVVPEALPSIMLGHHVDSLTGWLHYGLAVTIDQSMDVFSYHL